MADTAPPPGVVESAYAFSSGPVTLAGTLTRPRDAAAPQPAAVIVGPSLIDRDGNAPPAVRTNLYAQLAWRLAERGIASLRYNQRGLPSPVDEIDEARAGLDDFALDVKASTDALRDDPRFTIIVAVGHGEGAALVLRAANAGAPVAGVALLAGHATFEVFHSALMRDTLVDFDPLAEVARVPVPVLIVHGRRDRQVSERDAELLFGARRDARVVILADANHVFKSVAGDAVDAQEQSYRDPSVPLARDLVEVLVDWVRSFR